MRQNAPHIEHKLQTFIISPHLILMRDSKILLLKRADGAPVFPGHWHLPTGKMEGLESPQDTIVREAREEVGLCVYPTLATTVFVSMTSCEEPGKIWEDLCLFFVEKDLTDEPVNQEPRLHVQMAWFDVNALPDPLVPVVEQGIQQYHKGTAYGEFIG